ncbi:hypothetical protein EJ08DRAFT_696561 [Tothia fuscella]|uniref:RNA polymerase II degradation factor 1 n=1 Tax=Tothia fuscella TaxID=1048955 RepID=A0A9P4NTZ0_9PEZI|nr:hypothetical protein EJ08DRAFT_696561 [Tothia fuscella]
MSEAVASRPVATRGRGSARGGRGGARGGRGRDRHVNGTSSHNEPAPEIDDFEEEGELGEMRKQYSDQLPTLKAIFEDWTDADLLFALQETDGNLESTIDRISTGHVSKFSDVKSSKEKSKPKAKDPAASFADGSRPSRGGRGGFESTRGRDPRPDRGTRGTSRGVGRAGTHAATNGTRAPAAATQTSDSNAWDAAPAPETPATSGGDASAPKESAAKPAAKAAVETPQQAPASNEGGSGPKKTWAQMFAKPPPAPLHKTVSSEAAPAPEGGVTPSETSSGFVEVTHEDAEPEDSTPPITEVPTNEPPELSDLPEPTITLTPSKDQLTIENVEHLPDTAHPAPVGTAASEVESSRGPDSVTPSVAGQVPSQPPIGRPMLGGFATSAYKATATPGGRSASFQRRIMEQQEAVVMPGNHLVDRTAVQFGSLGLNGDALDVDEEREEPETRAQPPGHSPVAAPRASLPPVARQAPAPAETSLPQQETPSAPKQAPGLPPVPQQQAFAQQSPGQLASQAQGGQGYNQFGRYGQAATETPAQKAYDPFAQQQAQASPYDAYPGQSQAAGQQSQGQSHLGGYSTAGEYANQYYTADQRNAFNSYYGYNQQTAAQDAGHSQQRTGSAFGAAGDPAFPTSQSQQQTQPRFNNENQPSGHTTPNPAASAQQAGAQSQQAQLQQQAQGQHAGYANGYHPYYNSPYYGSYMNNYGGPYAQQQGYGQPFGGKGGMYNQPHHPYSQYDQHSSSPANASGFAQGRDSTLTSGLGEYGRSGSAQPSQSQQQSGAGAFGGINDPFTGRSQGAFANQGQYNHQQGNQQGSNDDALKPFGDSKSGPSPSALGQPGRPGSATNTTGQAGQTGLPPPQSHQQGFGSYPGGHQQGFGAQTSQYGGGLGGLGGHAAGAQSHQGAAGYGGYGAAGQAAGANAGFGNSYGSYNRGGGGGWGGNYGH